ncbi:SusC/RagA family TonB-linked outer membrane protein [Flammeovirgaceae bacterium SG7u.111]|nr:SusC/RagA family TonB-linked outer membrane protein [Flammeovirgaceae bacterium SG7u.132]WPO38551.1 SusC/RagA family TonB-linked outer membrane protein [Flammeovirgaceae bacterium SG7u.111]
MKILLHRTLFMKFLMSMLLFVSISNLALAQERTITGEIKDNAGEMLPGVSVLVKGTTLGTVTDLDGKYKLTVPETAQTLIYSYVGFASQEVEISSQTSINVILLEDVEQLDEVIVTALGIEREKKALGYAVQEVQGEDLTEARESNLVNSLAGRVAGVHITNGSNGVGATSRITIRGESSLAGDNQPLFVVDGIPINNSTDARTTSKNIASNMAIDYGNGAAAINPDDIETISVLKGANATALYGSRAANGVVLVTTKSGKGKKGIGVSINSNVTFEEVLKSPNYQRVYGQGKAEEFEFVNGYGSGTFDGVDESWGPRMDGRLIKQFDSPTANGLRGGDIHGLDRVLGPSGIDLDRRGEITPTPWVDHGDPVEQFFETGTTYSNNISLYGSNDQGDFRLSYTNFDNKGMLPNTDLSRNTFNLSASYKLTDKFRVNTKASYINSHSDNRHVNGYGTESVMYLFTWLGQQVNFKSLENYWQEGLEGFQQYNYNYNYHDNPYFTMYENTNGMDQNRLIGNISLSYDITDDLSLMVRGGTDFYGEIRPIKRAYSTQRFPRGQYREDKINFKETNVDFLLSYKKQINDDWFASVSFGGNQMHQERQFHAVSNNQLVIPGVYTFTNTDIPLATSIDRPEKQINSLYGFGQVAYKNMLFLDLTARNDWSSTLPSDNNSYFYPSVTLSGVVSEMVQLPSAISFFKLRAGWAQVGNDTDPYRLTTPYNFDQNTWGSNLIVSESGTLSNSDLKPEILTSYEVGTDLRFLQNRVGIDFTYYYSSSKNQIIGVGVPITTGYTSQIINAGEIVNKGVEVMLNATPIRTASGFEWNAFVNFTRNRNEVVELADGIDKYSLGGNRVDVIAEVGQSMGAMYGTGFLEHEGEVIFREGLPVASNELRYLGNYNPDFMVGLTNEFRYKNLSFSFLFDWREGGELYSETRLIAATAGNVDETLFGRDTEFGGVSWVDANGNTRTDGIIGEGVKEVFNSEGEVTGYVKNDVATAASSYHNKRYKRENETEGMYDASFIKLREMKLTYQLPSSLFVNNFLQSVSVSAVGRNLAIWNSFPHGDSEVLGYVNGQFLPGIEAHPIPSARSWGFNVNLKF